MSQLFWLDSFACRNAARVGQKAARLSGLYPLVRRLGAPVPPGFCLPAQDQPTFFTSFLDEQLTRAYAILCQQCGSGPVPVAVRASLVNEAQAEHPPSVLNVVGIEALRAAVERCWAGSPNPTGVLVQQLIPADISFVAVSADPRTAPQERVIIQANWGLGGIGAQAADTYVARKFDGRLLNYEMGEKTRMMTVTADGLCNMPVPTDLQMETVLTESQVERLTRLARTLEMLMGYPVQVEGACWGELVYLLQCQPLAPLPAPLAVKRFPATYYAQLMVGV